jgi:hypothetical protein
MSASPDFPGDAPPRTELTVAGETHAANGGAVSAHVVEEGAHLVQWCARDLAGNGTCAFGGGASRSDGSAGTAMVRIDKTSPSVAFTNTQDPEDPDKLTALVGDHLSGVTGGSISYRQDGGSEWKTLDTQLKGGQLVARVDSGDMRPGITYEFRASATDAAGNTQVTGNKANGEPMRVVGPFRALTGVVDLRVNGKAKARIGYDKKATLSGMLVAGPDQEPVGNVPIEITEAFAPGSKAVVRQTATATDSQGRFAIKLAKGPSRQIAARFRGDRRRLGAESTPAKLSVKSKVTLNTPARVSSRRGIKFAGRIKAKGAKFARKGKRLEVQVRVGRRWRAVGKSIRTNRKGKFQLGYDFTAQYTRAVEYQFRAVVLREQGFPFLPSKSKIRRVIVTP